MTEHQRIADSDREFNVGITLDQETVDGTCDLCHATITIVRAHVTADALSACSTCAVLLIRALRDLREDDVDERAAIKDLVYPHVLQVGARWLWVRLARGSFGVLKFELSPKTYDRKFLADQAVLQLQTGSND